MNALIEDNLSEVKYLAQRFLDSFESSDPNRFFDFLNEYIGEDTELITPEGKIIKGGNLMPFYHSFFDAVFQNFNVVGRFFDEKFTVSTDLGVHRYSYKMDLTPKEGGGVIIEVGHGVKTYKKYPDGTWKLQYDVWANPE